MTDVIQLHNNTTLSMDNIKVTERILKLLNVSLLEVSPDFDNIKHSILVDGWTLWDGVSGIALFWFACFLTDRHQMIKTEDCFCCHLIFRVVFFWMQFWYRYFYTVHNSIELIY